ncbi:sulfurtransferase [Dactylosporangium sp. NPDC051485]|uniref:sulfurtransferase n=1 Tax=Dactylosporangium sp. NPDC051485 TaxID=3154846 RepID=UPI00341C5DD9
MSTDDPLTLADLRPIVDAGWLRRSLDRVVVADVRWYLDGRSGREAYLAGHIPGAIWVDVDTVLSAPADPRAGRHPLPDPADFARSLGGLGIPDTVTVVAYDDSGGAYAARLVWLLRRLGRPAALLDGGLAAWQGDLDTGQVTLPPVRRASVEWPADRLRTADDVERAVADGTAVVLDARAPERYSGDSVLPTDVRSGHIPGAKNAPWPANLTPDGTFATPDRLRERYGTLGIDPGAEVIVYCGSGVTACHDLLALELAGIDNTALYPGSWSAWSADPARSIAVGPLPAGAM